MSDDVIKVSNKIISVESIIKIAEYLESEKNRYDKLFTEDKKKNEGLPYNEKRYEYNGENPKVEYTIEYIDGRSVTQKDYNWFLNSLNDTSKIKHIGINQLISFHSNYEDINNNVHKSIYVYIDFYEEKVRISVDGKEMINEVDKNYDKIRNIFNKDKIRYDKTIKNRKIRMQTFYWSIGFVVSYILGLILLINLNKIPDTYMKYIENKNILAIVFWGIAIAFGNVIGFAIMNNLYKNIIPEKKYVRYDSQSGKSVYADNVDEYTEKNEVQIGRFHNSIKTREKIENIFNKSKIIVLAQIVITVLVLLFVK